MFSAIITMTVFGLLFAGLRFGFPRLWARAPTRIAYGFLLGIAFLAGVTCVIGVLRDLPSVVSRGTSVLRVVVALTLPLAVAVPISVVVYRVLNRWFVKPRTVLAGPAATAGEQNSLASASGSALASSDRQRQEIARRQLVQWAAASVPAVGLIGSSGGVLMAYQPPRLPHIPMLYPKLPDALRGLRILHLSDLHLGYFLHVQDVRACLARAAALSPDLIVFTGDIADDLDELEPALLAAVELRPKLGVFASLGNHEHFRGVGRVRRIFDKTPVPLLIDAGANIKVGDASLYIAGANDPKSLGGDIHPFLERTVGKAIDGSPSDAFHLLLSHRPQGFDAAVRHGLALTLSGHTHGVQIGFKGRSLFDQAYPDKYLWGGYEQGNSRLYTSSGFGHWFPVRLGCPTEAPLIILDRSPADA